MEVTQEQIEMMKAFMNSKAGLRNYKNVEDWFRVVGLPLPKTREEALEQLLEMTYAKG